MSPSTTFSYDTYDSNNIGLIKKLIQNHYRRSAHLRKQTNTIDFSSSILMNNKFYNLCSGLRDTPECRLSSSQRKRTKVSCWAYEALHWFLQEFLVYLFLFSRCSRNRDYQSLMESIYNDYSREYSRLSSLLFLVIILHSYKCSKSTFFLLISLFLLLRNGYSKIVSTNTFGFATNACYNIKSKMLILYDTENDSLLQYILSQSGQGSTLSFHGISAFLFLSTQ